MVATDRVGKIFADALEMLAQGRVRNSAEKAWGATDAWCWPGPAKSRMGRRRRQWASGILCKVG